MYVQVSMHVYVRVHVPMQASKQASKAKRTFIPVRSVSAGGGLGEDELVLELLRAGVAHHTPHIWQGTGAKGGGGLGPVL